MSNDQNRRQSVVPPAAPALIPSAPPLPAPAPLQRARDAAYRFIGYPSRPATPQHELFGERVARGAGRLASLGAQNATASHKTGLEINTIAINESGTHALLGGKEIFKTVKIVDGVCAEDLNLRTAIRSTPTQASGRPRQVYSIDIADVAWAKGDCGDYVAAATSSGKIILYDLGHAGLQAAQLHEHARQVHKVTFNPHRGNLLLSGSQDGTVRLWDVRDARNQASTLQSKRKYSGQSDGVRDVKWSPTDGVDFAFGTDSGWIQRWDMRNLKAAKVKVPAHALSCNIIDWHPDGKHIVSGSSDRTVRVWDFSAGRKGKASWEITTPYPVMNARWRPSCESSMPQDNGARQCTQLVTAYDREHPVVHIWDFRRPALPFREMTTYPSAPTDLLWHSQDLLWTVGREGVFLQSDIQHAPKVIDNRNLQSFAVSPLGDLSLFVQKRTQRRLPRLHETSTNAANTGSNLSVSPDNQFVSRSWEDDTLDHSFLSVRPVKHHSRTNSGARMNYTPGMPGRLPAILMLDEILHNRKSFAPHQHAVTGPVPYFADDNVFRFLAQKYSNSIKLTATIDAEFLQTAEKALNKNADAAEQAGQYRLAQTWRIIGFATINHLEDRAKYQREQQGNKEAVSATKHTNKPSLGQIAKRYLMEQTNSPITSAASMQPVTSLMQKLALPESTSNVPTPLARPVTSTIMAASKDVEDLPDVEKSEHLTLPPSLAANNSLDINTVGAHMSKKLTSDNLNNLQQQQRGTDHIDTVRRWSVQPRVPLTLDPVDENGVKVPPKLLKHDSEESFPFSFGTESREPSAPASFSETTPMQMVAERPSRSTLPDAAMLAANGLADKLGDEDRQHVAAVDTSPANWSEAPELAASALMVSDEDRDHTATSQASSEHLIHSSPAHAPILAAGGMAKPNRVGDREAGASFRSRYGNELYSLPDDGRHDLEEEKPFALVEMLRELLSYYSDGLPNVQVCSQLLTLLVPLLPQTHPLTDETKEATTVSYAEALTSTGFLPSEVADIVDKHLSHIIMAGLNPVQMEAILSSYHEQLQAHQLFVEAASLRKLAYPALPSVYEDGMKDVDIHFSGKFTCAYCHSPNSPYGNNMLGACLLCNHSAHEACLREWFSSGGDGCFTAGCLCDCVDGRWRDELKGGETAGKAKSEK